MNTPRNPSVRLERDRIAWKTVFALLLLAGLITVGCIAWAAGLLAAEERALGFAPQEASPTVVPTNIQGIRQTDVDQVAVGLEQKEEQRRRLESFGWADRQRGLVHLPIEDAIEWELRESAP